MKRRVRSTQALIGASSFLCCLRLELLGHLLHLVPHAQQVAAQDFGNFVLGVAAPQQLFDQVRVGAHVLQVRRQREDAVVVGAEPDVFDPDEVRHVSMWSATSPTVPMG